MQNVKYTQQFDVKLLEPLANSQLQHKSFLNIMQSLEFHSILKRIRWGGRRLGSQLCKPIGEETDYAESWELVDHGTDQSVVSSGPYRDWTLAELVARKEAELFGESRGRGQFPLLVKFLDATDRLSVQVHPNDEQAISFDPSGNGKTEAWVILEAEPESRLYAGLQAGVDRDRLRAAIDSGTIEECLHCISVKRGDCVFIPAGTVHAIGEGILLAEIQQSSDLTFRLFDWGRLGADGKPRTIHVEEALSCIDFKRGPVDPVTPQVIADGSHQLEELVRSDYFVIRRHTSADVFTIAPQGRLRIVMMLAGNAHLEGGGESRLFPLGRTMLLPAVAGEQTIRPEGEAIVLETFLP